MQKSIYARHVFPVPGRPAISVMFFNGTPLKIGKKLESIRLDAVGIDENWLELKLCFHWSILSRVHDEQGQKFKIVVAGNLGKHKNNFKNDAVPKKLFIT